MAMTIVVVMGAVEMTIMTMVMIQESYNTPPEHTPGNPLANYERNPSVASW